MKILITAGPTREPLDPVRYLSNRSSGKMGYAIAQAALDAGHEVVLVSGPVALAAPDGARIVPVTTSDEMYEAVHAWVGWADVCVLCAAVADFRPARVEPHKIKKERRASLTLELVPTRDILRSLRDYAPADGSAPTHRRRLRGGDGRRARKTRAANCARKVARSSSPTM